MKRWLPLALIVAVALLLRLAPLDRYVTPDEPAWVYRSFRFGQALVEGDLAAIPTTGHPGATTMWLGGLGLQIHQWLTPDRAAAHLDWLDGLAGLSPESAAAFAHLAFFLSGGRILVALTTAVGLVGVFALVDRLWGRPVAMLAALLLALDPFLAGHSGLLHLDGLLATSMTLSALAALLAARPPGPSAQLHPQGQAHLSSLALRGQDTASSPRSTGATYRWTALSGLLAGLALSTKTPGGFLAPFVALLLLAAVLTRRIFRRQAAIGLTLWALIAGLTFLALYPALWVDPLATLSDLFQVGERHVEGPIRPIFFHGQLTYDPDASFYPVVWLFRASPLVLVGLPIAAVVHLRRPGPRRFSIYALIALALGFGLFVTLVGKKHDRYLLPAFPPLTLVAALGWDEIRKLAVRRLEIPELRSKSRIYALADSRALASWLIPTAVILVQLLITLPYLATPLAYFNPLLGGPRAALNWLPVGWDEGLGFAARWLNQRLDAEQLIVATPSIPPFASFFVGQTALLSQETLSQADYVVSPPLQGAGQLIENEAHASIYDKRVGGISYATVVRNSAPLEQAAYLGTHARQGDLIILDMEAALSHLYDGPADLAVLADGHDPVQVAVSLDALLAGRMRVWYIALPAASPITARQIQRQLSCCARLVSTEAVAGATITEFTPSALQDRQPCDVSRITEHASRFGDALALTDALVPSDPIAWPNHVPLIVRWEALAPLSTDYRVILHLQDQAGRTWTEGGQEILDKDYRRPSAWSSGDWSDQDFQLVLPPAMPPGHYSVELGVFDPVSGVGLSAWDADGEFAGLSLNLGQVTIAPPSRVPTPWETVIAERFDPPLHIGRLALLGQDPPPPRILSGDRASFDLFWQATITPTVDYHLRWRLLLSEGDVALTETVPLSPYPTSRWRAQELEQVRYDLPVPPDLPADSYVLVADLLDPKGVPVGGEHVILAQVEILARDRLFSLPSDIAYPLDLRLGKVVHLRGFDVGALSASPGDRLPLTLYWQADGPTDLSYAVFVHLVGPDGMLHGQEDRPPAHGAAPTHSWAPGQVVIDEISLPVLADAPVGTYHIAVGLFDPNTGDRMPVYDPEGTELPNGQIVLPIEIKVE